MNRREALQALVSLPAVARISVAELKPDDVLVFECDDRITCDAAQRIKETAETVWPGRRVVVLEKGLHLKIVAGSEAPR